MPINPYMSATYPPKIKTGTTWDINLSNPFGQNFQGAMFKAPGPTTGTSFNPAPTPNMTAGGGLLGAGNTLQTGSTYTPPDPYAAQRAAAAGAATGANASSAAAGRIGQTQEQANAGAMATASNAASMGAGWMPQMPTMGTPNYDPGYQPGAFNTQYGTLENLQPYMNPYLDQIIERGNKNILASASARGLLGSTGTENQLGEWAAQAQSDAFNDAFGRFTQDRGYMTDVYQDNRNFGYNNYRDTNAWNYGLFSDEKADYDRRMADWYSQLNGISNTGINATNSSADVWGDYFKSLAQLYGNQGDVGAAQAMQQGNNNNGLISGLIGLLGL